MTISPFLFSRWGTEKNRTLAMGRKRKLYALPPAAHFPVACHIGGKVLHHLSHRTLKHLCCCSDSPIHTTRTWNVFLDFGCYRSNVYKVLDPNLPQNSGNSNIKGVVYTNINHDKIDGMFLLIFKTLMHIQVWMMTRKKPMRLLSGPLWRWELEFKGSSIKGRYLPLGAHRHVSMHNSSQNKADP